jgi:hypothetical protein
MLKLALSDDIYIHNIYIIRGIIMNTNQYSDRYTKVIIYLTALVWAITCLKNFNVLLENPFAVGFLLAIVFAIQCFFIGLGIDIFKMVLPEDLHFVAPLLLLFSSAYIMYEYIVFSKVSGSLLEFNITVTRQDL